MSEVLQIFRDAWYSVFNSPSAPSWQQFSALYSLHIPSVPMTPIKVSGQALYDTVLHAKASSPGFDGWTIDQLKLLPRPAWEFRAAVDNLMIQTATAPTAYVHVPVAMLRKNSDDPLSHRGIGVHSLLFRLTLKSLWPQLVEWLVQVCHSSQTGGFPKRDFRQSAWFVQLEIEYHNLLEQSLSGVLLDYDLF